MVIFAIVVIVLVSFGIRKSIKKREENHSLSPFLISLLGGIFGLYISPDFLDVVRGTSVGSDLLFLLGVVLVLNTLVMCPWYLGCAIGKFAQKEKADE